MQGNAKEELEDKKKCIQEMLKKGKGLIVEKPKVGSGNTNNENTARRLFL